MLRVLSVLTAAFAAGSVCAATPMLVATSPHFKIYSAEKADDLRARAIGLERYDAVLHHLTGTPDRDDVIPLTVYMVPDLMDVGAGMNTLGYYAPTAAGPFAVVPHKLFGSAAGSIPQIILFHEYAHHFMLANFPVFYSPWFVEGFAEFYSTADVSGPVASIGQPEPLRLHTLIGTWMTPLSYLMAPGDRGLSAQQTGELYARAWLLVHYLTMSKQRAGQIGAYLQARSGGQSEEQAFRTAFHTTMAGMDQELKAYFAPHQLSYIGVNVPESAPVEIHPASPAEIAISKLMPRLRALQEQQESMMGPESILGDRVAFRYAAGKLAQDARAAARNITADGSLDELVAECEATASEWEQAAASAHDAIGLVPTESRAHLVLAQALLAKAPAGDPQQLSAARKEIVVANQASPNDPMPLIAYYQSFADHGASVPPIAVKGLERAQELAPQDQNVRIMLAKEKIALKQFAVAANLLRPVALSPHDSTQRDTAQTLLKTLPVEQEQAPPPIDQGKGQQTSPPPVAGNMAAG